MGGQSVALRRLLLSLWEPMTKEATQELPITNICPRGGVEGEWHIREALGTKGAAPVGPSLGLSWSCWSVWLKASVSFPRADKSGMLQ